ISPVSPGGSARSSLSATITSTQVNAARLNEPLDHGRCREHRGTGPSIEEAKDLGGFEGAGFGDDVDTEPRNVGHDVEARAVAHGCRMHDGIARRDRIDLRGVGMAHN